MVYFYDDSSNPHGNKFTDKRRAMLFLYKERTPVLKIELEDETIYLNSEDEEETVGWYEMVK